MTTATPVGPSASYEQRASQTGLLLNNLRRFTELAVSTSTARNLSKEYALTPIVESINLLEHLPGSFSTHAQPELQAQILAHEEAAARGGLMENGF
ncbi:hypothetical protein [Arthrobacter sp. 260]|uniref:hypothetical protein n=1 Tax=Arthrobacter sp. 260 TaxID=2735314 RepID=UPI00149270EC|nr:hypothetical protein [Arthrobacter sp. 260]NOJ61013.1 hypothetical protein [Arthrobacter sp. 260]